MEQEYQKWIRANMPKHLLKEFLSDMDAVWRDGIEGNKRCVGWMNKHADLLRRAKEARGMLNYNIGLTVSAETIYKFDKLLPEAKEKP